MAMSKVSRARVWIDDQGAGIPAAERERVWGSFYRRAEHANSAVAGSGIGLYVVRELARLHGGDAWIEDARQVRAVRYQLRRIRLDQQVGGLKIQPSLTPLLPGKEQQALGRPRVAGMGDQGDKGSEINVTVSRIIVASGKELAQVGAGVGGDDFIVPEPVSLVVRIVLQHHVDRQGLRV